MKYKEMAPNFVPHLIDLSPDTTQEPTSHRRERTARKKLFFTVER